MKGDFNGLAACMRKSWLSKKKLADSVSDSHLDNVIGSALDAGARAGKVSGAGGGGFVIFLVEPERRMNVIRELSRQNGRVTVCHFSRRGSEGWKIL